MEEGTRKLDNKGEQRNDESGVKTGKHLKAEAEIRAGKESIYRQLHESW